MQPLVPIRAAMFNQHTLPRCKLAGCPISRFLCEKWGFGIDVGTAAPGCQVKRSPTAASHCAAVPRSPL